MIDDLAVQALKNRVRKLEELTMKQGFMLDALADVSNRQQLINAKMVQAMLLLQQDIKLLKERKTVVSKTTIHRWLTGV